MHPRVRIEAAVDPCRCFLSASTFVGSTGHRAGGTSDKTARRDLGQDSNGSFGSPQRVAPAVRSVSSE